MSITLKQRQDAWALLTDATRKDKARQLAEDMSARQKAILANSQWSEEYKRERLTAERDQARQQVEAWAAQVEGARQTLRTAAEELSQPSGDATAQLLAETRQQRAWERVRPLLDKGRPWFQVLTAAEESRDAATLLGLSAELPSYLDVAGGKALDLPGVRQALDLAIGRGLGDDKGPGTAAQLRVFEAAAGHLAEVRLQGVRSAAMGLPPGLGEAITGAYAQDEYDRVRAELDGPTSQSVQQQLS